MNALPLTSPLLHRLLHRLLMLVLVAGTLSACSKGLDSAEDIQFALVQAGAGETIELPAGTFSFQRGLTLAADGVTLRGAGSAGSGATVLSFAGQLQGAEGLLVTSDNVTLEGFAIEDAKGDALKVNGATNVIIRDVRTEWTRGPHTDNGAYGIYPVQCENLLIENSSAIGASDAGIYVGQSNNIVVRNNSAEYNVAGIEIENSTLADVYGNKVQHNTGGILVFDLPNLPVQGGQRTRVYKNAVHNNNTANFAPPGNIVATVPAGTGIMINANDQIEVFDNVVADHQTANMLVVSYLITGIPVTDPDYDPYPEAIHIHHNSFGRAGWNPDSEPLRMVHAALGQDLPAVLWDGMVNPAKLIDGRLPAADAICVRDNGDSGVANLDGANNFAKVSLDPAPFACRHEPLPPVELPF